MSPTQPPSSPSDPSTPAPRPAVPKLSYTWHCAFCMRYGRAMFEDSAHSALVLHVARRHPLEVSRVGSTVPDKGV